MRDTFSDTLPDIFAVSGVELRVGSRSVADDNTLTSLPFRFVASLTSVVDGGCSVSSAPFLSSGRGGGGCDEV